MKAMRRFIQGALIFTLAAGFGSVPAAAAVQAPSADCEPGLYLLYSNGELVGALLVRSDCTTQVFWAE